MGAVLVELAIRDIGVIRSVTLDLSAGLNVLTGETGAGKTMVVAAVELLMGARADTSQVRPGASAALVEGRLVPPPSAAREWLVDGDDELVVAREIVDGRSRARLGGRMAPVSSLAAALADEIEVHGQDQSVRLGEPTVQRDLLDRSGGAALAAARSAYTDLYERWRALCAEQATLATDQRDRARELDRLGFELGEIDAVAPVAGEEEALDGEISRLEHAESLIAAAATAAAALTDDGGARDALGAALAGLRPVATLDDALGGLAARAEALFVECQDLGLELGGYAAGLELDDRRLEQLRQRRAALAGLTRKYGADAAAVLQYAESVRARLTVLEDGADRTGTLAVEVERLGRAVEEAAAALRAARTTAGTRLCTAAQAHLAELAMPAARMRVELEPVPPGPHGADRVRFLLAANPGQPPLPLGKFASGGERSRVALAIRLALADADRTSILVFDEVDAGIGGRTALAVGSKLAALARGRQVLCVTHLPQLAAYADAHFWVRKTASGGTTSATVERLDEPGRARELSRMLAGTTDSAAAAATAAELLALARDR